VVTRNPPEIYLPTRARTSSYLPRKGLTAKSVGAPLARFRSSITVQAGPSTDRKPTPRVFHSGHDRVLADIFDVERTTSRHRDTCTSKLMLSPEDRSRSEQQSVLAFECVGQDLVSRAEGVVIAVVAVFVVGFMPAMRATTTATSARPSSDRRHEPHQSRQLRGLRLRT
jgi:hypothetical protein